MPTYFQRPENALKRANEFIDVGKKQRALDALYDVIKSRKHRTWTKIHEPIMTKYLELCVELKKSHTAKEGLFQYRNICQQVNIKSLEDVVRMYLRLAEEKTEAARQESQQSILDIDDLDQMQTPESLLLSAVSSEDTQDRKDRVVLTPWVKFLWESYRQCLELLRNNSRVERLYHDIAQQAFKFCLKYSRKTEFRKLCDNLRTHFSHIQKHQNQQTAVNLNNPESQAMHLETRLVQLDIAIQMELWQEAYKAVEDIHSLMALSKKPPKPQLMANYRQKLALVFWKAGNYLFHACALFRLFHLSRELKKNITADEIQRMASRVVVATLAIPMPPNRPEIDRLVETDENIIDKNNRMLATLLGLSNPPTRSSLVKDLLRFGVIQYAHPHLQDLYRWLEVEFHPLKLCNRVSQCIDFLNKWEDCPDLKQYIPCLQNLTIMRLLKEVSQVYHTIELTHLMELTPFADKFYLEKMVVEAVRRNDLQVRIDHRQNCLHFGSELTVSQHEEMVEGPHLQSMPSEQIRNQLVSVHSVLHKAVTLIQPEKIKSTRQDLREQIVAAYKMTAKKEHRRILERQQIIEERKELMENLDYQKEEEERKLLEERQQKLREAEEVRMAKEAEERAKQRILQEQNEMKKKVVLEKIEQLKKTELGARIFEGLEEEELEKLDPEDILTKQVEQLDRERKELQAKLRKQEKKIDHLERAKRIEEIPYLQKAYEEFKVENEKLWYQEEEERIKQLIAKRKIAVQHRNRLAHMKEDKDEFVNKLKAERMSVYKEKLAEFEKMLAEERKVRLKERKEKRKEERRRKWIKEKEEEEQRKRDEEKKREYEEKLAKLEELEAKKRARELEIEEKLRQEEEERTAREREEKEAKKQPQAPEEVSWRRKEGEEKRPEAWKPSSHWRERELAKKESWGPRYTASKDNDVDWRKRSDRDEPPPTKGEEWRRERERDLPRRDRDEVWRATPPVRRPPPSDDDNDWRRPKEDRDIRGSPFDQNRDVRGPPPDRYRDMRGPPPDRDKDMRGPPPDRDMRGPDPDMRGPPLDGDHDWRGRDIKSLPSRESSWRGPPPRERDTRGPPPERSRDWRDRPSDRDKGWRGDDRRPQQDRDGGSWRERGTPSRTQRDAERDWRSDDRGIRGRDNDDWRSGPRRGPPERKERSKDEPDEEGWRTVRR
ncbi:eukaryotic translation initiation factor 3 subunit A-like [Limulus polyphemus]|uniref:Eukaryotic translation initiation factor 3 subunit A n=1 Tax=Limulus polyphemus TaxID=6850 RepID=A0ABM1BGS8_LIMPO|nr:eukaryotic translation initiation factor 3 subunit A-like [Limulus polyphemus]